MIRFKLSPRTENLKPYLRELLLYSGINNITVEIGDTQSDPNSVFVSENHCETLEDVLSSFALKIYNQKTHTKCMPSSVISLEHKHGHNAGLIASVIEKAIEPATFFGLEGYKLI